MQKVTQVCTTEAFVVRPQRLWRQQHGMTHCDGAHLPQVCKYHAVWQNRSRIFCLCCGVAPVSCWTTAKTE